MHILWNSRRLSIWRQRPKTSSLLQLQMRKLNPTTSALQSSTDRQSQAVVLLLEYVMCSFFSALDKAVYRSTRSPDLLLANWRKGTDRKEPLCVNEGVTRAKAIRDRNLENALAGGPEFVCHGTNKNGCTSPFQNTFWSRTMVSVWPSKRPR